MEIKRTKAAKIIAEMEEDFNFDDFGYRYAGKTPPALKNKQSVYTGFEDYIQILDANKQFSTRDGYINAMKSFKRVAPDNLTYKDVTVRFLQKYEAQMLANGMAKATLGMYTRYMRCIFNNARRDKIIPYDLYPFGSEKDHKYEIPIGKNVKKAMKPEEFSKVLNYDATGQMDEFEINLFQFSLRCNGMNMADIFELRNENVKGEFLEFDRLKTVNTKKTPEPIRIFITPEIQSLIDRWKGDEDNPKAYLFPVYLTSFNPQEKYDYRKEKIQDINLCLKRLQ